MSEIDRLKRALQHKRAKHRSLDAEVTALERTVGSGSFKLIDKKRLRLRVKDEISSLEAQLGKLERPQDGSADDQHQIQAMASG